MDRGIQQIKGGRVMRIAITGATGLLGRNFLFEVIKNNLHNLEEMEILLLGRSSNEARIRERIEDIITEDGALYLSLSDYEFEDIKTAIFSSIKCVNMDIDAPKMGISTDDFNMLKREPIDVFFHIAALSDFRDSPKVVEALKRINFNGTKQILDLISLLKVDKFYYTSSAYSCGETAGDINPDYINLNQGFRNPYERSKLETEVLVRERSKETGLKCKFFRPSTISGRLMEDPAGSANKFDVFYSWAAFFLHLKTKQLDAIDYSTPVTLDARILFNPYSGLNIVPADYAAKVSRGVPYSK
jgi:nucleoside-diphosphate-sugar epimerase